MREFCLFVWNRFQGVSGIRFLESSNVNNSYGVHNADNLLDVPDNPNYTAIGNPNGLEPTVPNVAPPKNELGQPQPYIASNQITVFSILDTELES